MVDEADAMARRRERLVAHLRRRGIYNLAVLAAFRHVPRERFVDEQYWPLAYKDVPLPIDAGQTISQPFMIAVMLRALALAPADRVLEVGAGSGYAAALLSRLAAEVYTVERHEMLAESARCRLRELGYDTIRVRCGDGSLGWPEHAPYNAIVVAAGSPSVPPPLEEQLALGGRLVIPVGSKTRSQRLVRVVRRGPADFARQNLGPVRFVPLVGREGWTDPEAQGGLEPD